MQDLQNRRKIGCEPWEGSRGCAEGCVQANGSGAGTGKPANQRAVRQARPALNLDTAPCPLLTPLHCSRAQSSEADGLLLLGRLLHAWAAAPFEFTATGKVLLDLARLCSPLMKVLQDAGAPDSTGEHRRLLAGCHLHQLVLACMWRCTTARPGSGCPGLCPCSSRCQPQSKRMPHWLTASHAIHRSQPA